MDVPHGSPVEGPAGVLWQVGHLCQRFDRWSGNGATGRLSTALQEERIIGVEIRVPAMDSTSVKVYRHAAGAPKKGARSVGVSRGGRNTKVRVVSDSESTVVRIHVSPGDEHDATHGRRSMAALGAFMGAPCPWTARTRGIRPGRRPSRSA